MTAFPSEAAARKSIPLASVLDYFPAALAAVARVSAAGNAQHHADKPLHWDRAKSSDHADALLRHFVDRGTKDSDGVRHSAKVAWRALALLQVELEREEGAPVPRGAMPPVIPHHIAAAALRDRAMADDDATDANPISPAGAQSFQPVNQSDED